MKLIYTGYAWREMSKEEMEINADKPVFHIIPLEPYPGDVMEVEDEK